MRSKHDQRRTTYGYSPSAITVDVGEIAARRNEPFDSPNSSDIVQLNLSDDSEKKSRCPISVNLILVIIIIAIICLAALAIGIYVLVINLTRATNPSVLNPASTSASTTAEPVICTADPKTTYQYATRTPPECINYTLNTDRTRNIGYTSSIDLCDNIDPFINGTEVWIRFDSPAGTVIPKESISLNRCGAIATGWYAGQYPESEYSTATSIVCFYENTNTCGSCRRISITNCRRFFVFLLPIPPSCNHRYCTV